MSWLVAIMKYYVNVYEHEYADITGRKSRSTAEPAAPTGAFLRSGRLSFIVTTLDSNRSPLLKVHRVYSKLITNW